MIFSTARTTPSLHLIPMDVPPFSTAFTAYSTCYMLQSWVRKTAALFVCSKDQEDEDEVPGNSCHRGKRRSLRDRNRCLWTSFLK